MKVKLHFDGHATPQREITLGKLPKVCDRMQNGGESFLVLEVDPVHAGREHKAVIRLRSANE